MKKYLSLFLLLCLLLTACGPKVPEAAADGSVWQESWDTVGSLLGIEPMEGWAVQRNEDVLAAEGTFYTAWTKGDSFRYENAAGDEVVGYDGQIHLVVIEGSPESTQSNAALWEQLIDERYADAVKSTQEFAGQEFSVAAYDFQAGDVLLHGASATAIRGDWAIHADVITKNEDARAVLEDFWSHCHWAA